MIIVFPIFHYWLSPFQFRFKNLSDLFIDLKRGTNNNMNRQVITTLHIHLLILRSYMYFETICLATLNTKNLSNKLGCFFIASLL